MRLGPKVTPAETVADLLEIYAKHARARVAALETDAAVWGKVKDTDLGHLIQNWEFEATRAEAYLDHIRAGRLILQWAPKPPAA